MSSEFLTTALHDAQALADSLRKLTPCKNGAVSIIAMDMLEQAVAIKNRLELVQALAE